MIITILEIIDLDNVRFCKVRSNLDMLNSISHFKFSLGPGLIINLPVNLYSHSYNLNHISDN